MDSASLFILALVILSALTFNFLNGRLDAGNALSTTASTRAQTPRQVVFFATVFTFIGALISTQVAITIATGIVDAELISTTVVLAAVLAAIGWNLVTKFLGIPSSSSHALLGGAVGAVIAAAGVSAVEWDTVISKMFIPALVAPMVAFVLAVALIVALYWTLRSFAPGPLNRVFRLAQTVSSALVAVAHGSNDSQKTMGIIVLALAAGGVIGAGAVPTWVMISAAIAMALGTYTGGMHIVRTRGMRVVKMEPINGFTAETTAAATTLAATAMGFPVSTTHVVHSSIVGVGITRRFSAERWGIARRILTAWIVTIPASGLIAAGLYLALAAMGMPEASAGS